MHDWSCLREGVKNLVKEQIKGKWIIEVGCHEIMRKPSEFIERLVKVSIIFYIRKKMNKYPSMVLEPLGATRYWIRFRLFCLPVIKLILIGAAVWLTCWRILTYPHRAGSTNLRALKLYPEDSYRTHRIWLLKIVCFSSVPQYQQPFSSLFAS